MNDYHLVQFDPPGVQRFIFQTQKLKEIRAASALLEHGGQSHLKQLIDATQGIPLLLAGGGGAVFVPEPHKDRFIRELKKLLNQHLPGVPFILTEERHRPGEKPYETRRRASARFQMPELMPTPLLGPSTLGCASCRSAPAAVQEKKDERKTLLCQRCSDKRQTPDQDSAFQASLRSMAGKDCGWPQELAFAEDLIDIAEKTQTRKEYLALISIDANGMGQYFQRTLAEVKTLADCHVYHRKSDQIKQRMVEAFARAVIHTWPRYSKRVPAEMLYLGGDDAVMVCAADQALVLARQIATQFAQDTELKAFTLAIGVVFARHNTPMFTMLDLGQDLVTSAKRRAKAKGEAQSVIDFEVLLGQTFGDLDRDGNAKEGFCRSGKPYTCTELEKLETAVSKLKPLAGRLFDLEAACASMSSGNLEAIKLLGRMDGKDFALLSQHFKAWGSLPPQAGTHGYPWIPASGYRQKPYTILRDVLELMPFLGDDP